MEIAEVILCKVGQRITFALESDVGIYNFEIKSPRESYSMNVQVYQGDYFEFKENLVYKNGALAYSPAIDFKPDQIFVARLTDDNKERKEKLEIFGKLGT